MLRLVRRTVCVCKEHRNWYHTSAPTASTTLFLSSVRVLAPLRGSNWLLITGAENWSHRRAVFASMIHDSIISQQLSAAKAQPLQETIIILYQQRMKTNAVHSWESSKQNIFLKPLFDRESTWNMLFLRRDKQQPCQHGFPGHETEIQALQMSSPELDEKWKTFSH